MRLFADTLNNNRITRYLKKIRNSLLNSYFLGKGATYKSKQIEELANSPSLVFCIAFNKPVCIQIMVNCWSTFAKDTVLVVADNSTDLNCRKEIRKICKTADIHYIGLPKNPEWHPNRSHALAMNWVYYNFVRKMTPKTFGFLDHDCFPFAEFDLNRKMENKIIYGEKRISEKKQSIWSLWAGFCFFKYSFTKDKKLNFTHSIELGLDTGGSNWSVLYSCLNVADANFANTHNGASFTSSWEFNSIIDHFVHIGSAAHLIKSKKMAYEDLTKLIHFLNIQMNSFSTAI
jgi:hypothetical protein